MHAVGWRVVASVALDEATAGDETVAAAIVTVAAESGTFGPPLVSCRETRYIGVLAYLAQCAPSPVVPRPGDGSYSSTGLPTCRYRRGTIYFNPRAHSGYVTDDGNYHHRPGFWTTSQTAA